MESGISHGNKNLELKNRKQEHGRKSHVTINFPKNLVDNTTISDQLQPVTCFTLQ